MYGIFDIKYYEPWSKHIVKFMMQNGITLMPKEQKVKATKRPAARLLVCNDNPDGIEVR